MVVSTKFHYFKIVPPASPYIIIPPGGIIIYERSFFPATLGEIIKTYGAGRSFVTSPKDVNKNELMSLQEIIF